MNAKFIVSLCILAVCANAFSYTPTYRGLPSGYTQVEYIASSGSQYIDLGINARSGLAMETVMSWVAVPGDASYCAAKNTNRIYPLYYASGWGLGYNSWLPSGVKATKDEIYHAYSSLLPGDQKLSVTNDAGESVCEFSQSVANTYDLGVNLYLFASDDNGSAMLKSSSRCYELKFWSLDSEGRRTLLGDFVPCLNSSGVAGLYDLVGNKYLPPSAALAGYGNPVRSPVDPSKYDGNVFIGDAQEGDWFVPSNWSYEHVPTASEDAFIVSRAVVAAEQITARSLRIVGGTLKLGDEENRTRFTDNVAAVISGDLTVESNGCLTVYAGRLADEKLADLAHVDTTAYAALYAGATLVNVGGKLTVASGAILSPDCDPLTGTAVFFRPKDFEMDETARADVLKRGWRWFKTPEGVAPVGVRYEKQTSMYHTYAFGPGYSYQSQGGGYGSDAFNAADAAINTCTNVVDGVVYGEIYRRGGAYGSAYAPFLPGSQGGIQNDTTMPDCRAPGAFVVQATGTAVVKGAILAYGQKDSDWSHSSGGSIWIAANELKVSKSAIFDVHGGDTTTDARRPGAAGRVALATGAGMSAAWDAFAVSSGLPAGYAAENCRIPGNVNVFGGEMANAVGNSHSSWQRPDLGSATVVLPEDVSVEEVALDEPTVDRPAVVKTWIGGEGYWDRAENWSPAGVPATNDDVVVGAGVCRAPNGVEVGSLAVATGARLEAFSRFLSPRPRSCAWTTAFPVRRPFVVAGDVSVAGTLSVGGEYAIISEGITNCDYRVGGDLTVSGTGLFMVTAAASTGALATSNDVFAAKTDFTIGGKLAVLDTAKLIPDCDCFGGLPVRFLVGGFELAEGAQVNAVNRGYRWLPGEPYQTDVRSRYLHTMQRDNAGTKWITMSFDIGDGYTVSSGYGANSPNATTKRGLAYGNPYAPFLSGSIGGLYTWHYNDGGGVVWIVSSTTSSVDGLVDASGESTGGYLRGSGGSIWLSTMKGAAFGVNAKLCARGALGGYKTDGSTSGAGGRISITTGVTQEQLDAIALGTDPVELGIAVKDEIVAVATDVRSHESFPRSDGTTTTLTGEMDEKEVSVVGVGVAALGPEPGYGSALYSRGSHTFIAPAYGADPNEPNARRYPLVGYVVSNATEQVAEGWTGTATVDVQENLTVYWIWNVPTRERSVDVEGIRTWVTVGDSFTARATVPDGHEFLYWWGNVPYGTGLKDAFTFTVEDRPYALDAITRPVQEEVAVRTWTGGAGDWTDPAHWDGGVIPGLYDPVVVGSGSTISASNLVACGSIELRNATSILNVLTAADDTFEDARLVVTGGVTLASGAKLNVSSKGSRSRGVIEIGGDLTLTKGTVTVCAGPTTDDFPFSRGAGFVEVAGDIILDGTSSMVFQSDPYTGGSVKTTCRKLVLGENAKLDANARGFGVIDRTLLVLSECPGSGNSCGIGGGYGGKGGSANSNYGKTYGFANAPVHPGANSGVYGTYGTKNGGGLVRVHAQDLELNGTVDASGTIYDSAQIVAASGGGIWLTAADKLSVGPNAVFAANGTTGWSWGSADGPIHAGGGGRIAIGWKLSPAQIEALAEAGTYPGLRKGRFRTMDWFVEKFGLVTRPSVAPGVIAAEPKEGAAEYGTFTFLDATLPGLLLMVR